MELGTATQHGVTIESNSQTDAEVLASFGEGQQPKPGEPKPVQQPDDKPVELSGAGEAEPSPESEAGKTLAAKRRSLEGRKASIQSEIDTLKRTVGETQRERDQIAADVARLKAEQAALKPAQAAQPAGEKFPDYDVWAKTHPEASYEDYLDDRSEWRIEKRLAKERDAAQVAHSQQSFTAAQARVFEAGKQAHEDFEQVMLTAVEAGVKFSPVVSQIIAAEALGHELAYALARDPDESQRLSQLHPIAAAIEAGKIFARLEAAHSGPAPTPVREVSQAKAVIKPVMGSPAVSDDPPGEAASDEEHRQYWNRKDLARRRRA